MKEKATKEKKNVLEDSKAEKVLAILKVVEQILEVQEADSKVKDVIESQIVSKPRDKALKGTNSWCSNALIRLYHSHKSIKEGQKMPEFIGLLKENKEIV